MTTIDSTTDLGKMAAQSRVHSFTNMLAVRCAKRSNVPTKGCSR